MSDLINAIRQVCEEKGLSYEAVIETIESALAAAYRKDFGEKNQNIKVEFDPETGKSKVFDVKTVVDDMPEDLSSEALAEEEGEDDKSKGEKGEKEEKGEVLRRGSGQGRRKEEEGNKEIKETEASASPELSLAALTEGGVLVEEERKFNPKTELQITDAKLLKKTAKIGDEIRTKLEIPSEFGRMAAQTAKQVIIQRLREAEREMVFAEFKDKEREVVSGVVQRREGRMVLVDLGKAVGILPPEEQIHGERYNPGERVKVYIKEVRSGAKGAEVVLSRTSDEILKKVFYLEIPEISNGLVELKAVAREAGARSKVAVATESDNVDPVGSCVGQRGARIQTIINELGGEKVDIIKWDEDTAKFIENALSPAKVISIDLNPEDRKATVKVNADQLSLAIGKSGQNARLAAKLTGWGIDIVENEVAANNKEAVKKEGEEEKKEDEEEGMRNEEEGKEKEEKKATLRPGSGRGKQKNKKAKEEKKEEAE